MVKIDIAYEGSLHCSATHGPSRTKLATDAPTDNMGRGETFSPTDLVATALGSCMMTVMGIVAQRHGISLEGMHCSVEKEMVSAPQRRIGRLAVEIWVPTTVSEEDQRRLEHAVHACPVHRSLNPEIEIPIRFHWGQ